MTGRRRGGRGEIHAGGSDAVERRSTVFSAVTHRGTSAGAGESPQRFTFPQQTPSTSRYKKVCDLSYPWYGVGSSVGIR